MTRGRLPSYALVLSVVLGGVAACGPRTSSELIGDIGGDAVSGAEAGASDGTISDSFVGCHAPVDCARTEVSTPDVTMTSDVSSDAPVTCVQVGRNEGQNGDNCSMSTVVKCSNGIRYEASCSCESQHCFCTANEMYVMLPFSTRCSPSCAITPADVLKECGYPF